MPSWLVAFLAPLLRELARLVVDEFMRRLTVKEQEATDDPREAELLDRVRDAVGRVPPAAPPR